MRVRRPAHQATTAHLGGTFPFMAAGGLDCRRVYVGQDTHGGAFCYDCWELYHRGITSPNMLVLGQLGKGKSSLVKTYVWRQLAFGRRAVMLDPKGENGRLCQAVGVRPIRLEPGGEVRLNPLDPRVAAAGSDRRDVFLDQLSVLQALTAAALGRELSPDEEAALGPALLAATGPDVEPTLPQVADALLRPSEEAARMLATTQDRLAASARSAGLRLLRMCDGDLRGMFDGPTTEGLDLEAPLVSLDMSAVHSSPALGILMVCAAAWLRRALGRSDGIKRVVVMDEAWAMLSNLGVAKWMAQSFKLARATGVNHIAVVHRLTDLQAAGSSDSQQVRLARGLLSDTETQVIYNQSPDEAKHTAQILELSDEEASWIPRLGEGQALWRVGQRSFLVQHLRTEIEYWITDSDQGMNGAA